MIVALFLASLFGNEDVSGAERPSEVEILADLSDEELAGELLGRSGRIFREIDRPNPIYLGSVRLFSRPFITGSHFGVCAATWVDVSLDEDLNVVAIETEQRYGIEGTLYAKAGSWNYDDFGLMCEAAETTRSYFPAPSGHDALRLAQYVDVIQNRGPFADQPFVFECRGDCPEIEDTLLDSFRLDSITSVSLIDCGEHSLKVPDCYEVSAREDSWFPETWRFFGTTYRNRVRLVRVEVFVNQLLP